MPRTKSPPPPEPPQAATLEAVREQARTCRRCGLWKCGTQTVFGDGSEHPRFMLVGEQPGDVEDVEGVPFVGPAGRLLREALREAGIDESEVYLTNAVKHFKWRRQGKRRIHERPNREEILACRAWLDQEIALLKPQTIVALGATAAGVIIGSAARVMRDRAKPFPSPLASLVTLTVHPSSILRAPDSAARAEGRRQLVDDLRAIAALAERRDRPRAAGLSARGLDDQLEPAAEPEPSFKLTAPRPRRGGGRGASS
jgi:uracil-DNA glycosylase family protein